MEPNLTVIDFKTVKNYQNLEPKRICFATCHKEALRRFETGYYGKFSVPFKETFFPIFYHKTGIELRDGKSDFWQPLSESQYNEVKKFMDESNCLVYLRDSLSLSIALGERMVESLEERSEIGDLFNRAKYETDETAIMELSKRCEQYITKLPFFNNETLICAVPSSKNNKTSLPEKIVNNLTNDERFENISSGVQWAKEKPELKNMVFDEKWAELEKTGIEVKPDLSGKNIILLDDIYQSGTTMQFVGMKLQEAGAKKIFGLTTCKSMRNRDNQ